MNSLCYVNSFRRKKKKESGMKSVGQALGRLSRLDGNEA